MYHSTIHFSSSWILLVMGRTNNGERNKQMERIDYVIHLITTKNNNEASNPFRKRLITFHWWWKTLYYINKIFKNVKYIKVKNLQI